MTIQWEDATPTSAIAFAAPGLRLMIKRTKLGYEVSVFGIKQKDILVSAAEAKRRAIEVASQQLLIALHALAVENYATKP